MQRPFYISGRADDPLAGGARQANIGFMRAGLLAPRTDASRSRETPAIRYVRGRFQGWGYVNLARVARQAAGRDTHCRATASSRRCTTRWSGPLTNAFILGTFKGKLNDWDGDGYIDLNSRDVYSTAEGEVDTDMDGIPDQPGVGVLPRPAETGPVI